MHSDAGSPHYLSSILSAIASATAEALLCPSEAYGEGRVKVDRQTASLTPLRLTTDYTDCTDEDRAFLRIRGIRDIRAIRGEAPHRFLLVSTLEVSAFRYLRAG